MRRKSSIFAIFAALLLASCSELELQSPSHRGGEAKSVQLNINILARPVMTRANDYWTYDESRTNSNLGALSNCKLGDEYALRYQLEVWDKTGTERVIDRQVIVDQYEDVVSFNLNLYPDHDYRIVAWADLVRKADTYNLEEPWLDDLHYDTHDMKTITCKDDASSRLNDESRDAYWASEEIHIGQNTVLHSMTLRRPFAKLRIVTTDWEDKGLQPYDRIELRYKDCKRFIGMNAVTGDTRSFSTEDNDVVYTAILPEDSPYKDGYDADSVLNRTIVTDYLMADNKQETVHLVLRAYQGAVQRLNPAQGSTELEEGRHFDMDIPIQRNYLTTLMGNVLTTANNIRALCFEAFYRDEVRPYGVISWNDITPIQPQIRPVDESIVFPSDWVPYEHTYSSYHITRIEEWKWLFEKEGGWDFSHDHGLVKSVDIDADLNFENVSDLQTNIVHHPYTINGNGHVIRNFTQTRPTIQARGTATQNAAYLGVLAFMEPAVVKDLTFENITLSIPRRLGDDEHEWTARQLYAAPIASMDRASSQIRTCRLENVHSRHVTIYTPEGDDLGVAFVANKKKGWRDVLRYYSNEELPRGVQFFYYGRLSSSPAWEDTGEKSLWKDHVCFTWPGYRIDNRAQFYLPGRESAFDIIMQGGDIAALDDYKVLLHGNGHIPPQDFNQIYGIERCVRSWVTAGLVGLAQGILFKDCSVTDIRVYTNRNFGGLVGENMYCHYENNRVEEVKVYTSRRVDINLCKDIYTGTDDKRHYWAPVTGAIHWLIGLNNVTTFSNQLFDKRYWSQSEPWLGNQFSDNICNDFKIYDPDGFVNNRYVLDDSYQPILPADEKGKLNDAGEPFDCEYYHYDQGKPKKYWGWTYDRKGAVVDNTFSHPYIPATSREKEMPESPQWVDPETLVQLYDDNFTLLETFPRYIEK